MRLLNPYLPVAILLVHAMPGWTQTAVKDPSAVGALNAAINAAGGALALSPIQDFTASGTITYFWGLEPIQGSATVKARGYDQFRLDANLPEGIRSYALSHGQGALKEPDGTLKRIPYHNTVNVGIVTFPYQCIEVRLNDPSMSITDMGLVTSDAGGQLHRIHAQPHYPSWQDNGTLSKLLAMDYFLDPVTSLVSKTIDATHPDQTLTKSFPHATDFENYAVVNGVKVPMLVRETIDGQTTWELRLSNISFNTGLSDADFTLQ